MLRMMKKKPSAWCSSNVTIAGVGGGCSSNPLIIRLEQTSKGRIYEMPCALLLYARVKALHISDP